MLKVSCSELIAIKVKERDFTCVIYMYIYTCVIYIQFTHDIYTPVIYTLHLCDTVESLEFVTAQFSWVVLPHENKFCNSY